MEKILFLMFCVLTFCSCQESRTKSNEISGIDFSDNCRIEEIQIKDRFHEFLCVDGFGSTKSLTHLPDCKFCGNVARIRRIDMMIEGEEMHEMFIIDTDTAVITNHCDDCRFCIEANLNTK